MFPECLNLLDVSGLSIDGEGMAGNVTLALEKVIIDDSFLRIAQPHLASVTNMGCVALMSFS